MEETKMEETKMEPVPMEKVPIEPDPEPVAPTNAPQNSSRFKFANRKWIFPLVTAGLVCIIGASYGVYSSSFIAVPEKDIIGTTELENMFGGVDLSTVCHYEAKENRQYMLVECPNIDQAILDTHQAASDLALPIEDENYEASCIAYRTMEIGVCHSRNTFIGFSIYYNQFESWSLKGTMEGIMCDPESAAHTPYTGILAGMKNNLIFCPRMDDELFSNTTSIQSFTERLRKKLVLKSWRDGHEELFNLIQNSPLCFCPHLGEATYFDPMDPNLLKPELVALGRKACKYASKEPHKLKTYMSVTCAGGNQSNYEQLAARANKAEHIINRTRTMECKTYDQLEVSVCNGINNYANFSVYYNQHRFWNPDGLTCLSGFIIGENAHIGVLTNSKYSTMSCLFINSPLFMNITDVYDFTTELALNLYDKDWRIENKKLVKLIETSPLCYCSKHDLVNSLLNFPKSGKIGIEIIKFLDSPEVCRYEPQGNANEYMSIKCKDVDRNTFVALQNQSKSAITTESEADMVTCTSYENLTISICRGINNSKNFSIYYNPEVSEWTADGLSCADGLTYPYIYIGILRGRLQDGLLDCVYGAFPLFDNVSNVHNFTHLLARIFQMPVEAKNLQYTRNFMNVTENSPLCYCSQKDITNYVVKIGQSEEVTGQSGETLFERLLESIGAIEACMYISKETQHGNRSIRCTNIDQSVIHNNLVLGGDSYLSETKTIVSHCKLYNTTPIAVCNGINNFTNFSIYYNHAELWNSNGLTCTGGWLFEHQHIGILRGEKTSDSLHCTYAPFKLFENVTDVKDFTESLSRKLLNDSWRQENPDLVNLIEKTPLCFCSMRDMLNTLTYVRPYGDDQDKPEKLLQQNMDYWNVCRYATNGTSSDYLALTCPGIDEAQLDQKLKDLVNNNKSEMNFITCEDYHEEELSFCYGVNEFANFSVYGNRYETNKPGMLCDYEDVKPYEYVGVLHGLLANELVCIRTDVPFFEGVGNMVEFAKHLGKTIQDNSWRNAHSNLLNLIQTVPLCNCQTAHYQQTLAKVIP